MYLSHVRTIYPTLSETSMYLSHVRTIYPTLSETLPVYISLVSYH